MAHAAPIWLCTIQSSKHNGRTLPDLRRLCQHPPSNPHRMNDRRQCGEEGWNTASTMMPSIAWLCLLGWKVVFTHLPDVAYHISPTRWVRGQGRLLNEQRAHRPGNKFGISFSASTEDSPGLALHGKAHEELETIERIEFTLPCRP